MSAAAKDLHKVIRAACRAGLVYSQHRHARLTDPATGRYVSFLVTPRCPHSYKHVLKALRSRLGIEVLP
jgi:hypothetical protein